VTDGIALLFKPVGITSFAALGELKRSLGTGHIGHSGTLDRFADGLLLALCGKLTRLCTYAQSMDKEYLAHVAFGRGTDTLDPEGRQVAEGPVPAMREIQEVLPSFLGEIMQIPPEYSAVHVNGRRAYQAAREDEKVHLTARPVTVSELELLEYRPPEAIVRIICSKGTYVRSLARDIASKMGTCAYVSGLRRTRIGGFRLEEAKAPHDFRPREDLIPPSVFFDRCPGLCRLTVKDEWIPLIANGVPPRESTFEKPPSADGSYGAFDRDGVLLAMVKSRDGIMRYAAVFSGTQSV
jgi:tRNA pseudouridine55 synthase